MLLFLPMPASKMLACLLLLEVMQEKEEQRRGQLIQECEEDGCTSTSPATSTSGALTPISPKGPVAPEAGV